LSVISGLLFFGGKTERRWPVRGKATKFREVIQKKKQFISYGKEKP